MLKSNEYFEGKVKSIGLDTELGPATVGVMEKGEYTFSTSTKELMVITTGVLKVKLPGETDFTTYKKGDEFRIEGNMSFSVIAENHVSYICYYG